MMNDQAGAAAGSNSRPQTEGEYRVGVTFNPSQSPLVASLKAKAASLIDDLLAIAARPDNVSDEVAIQANAAARAIEDAAMNAVKAATKAPRA